jgi:adenylate cyclase
VEIQRELAERNAELSYNRRMEFRIGINLGDIVEEEGRIYGDGVNIAARVESLAEGGGICISGTVHDHVKNKLGLEYEYLGEQAVKNIPEPVGVYRVLSFPGAAVHRVVKAKTATERKWRRAGLALAVALVLCVGAVLLWNFVLSPTPPSIEPASMERMAFPLPDKPSIAVMPFVNMSEDPKQEYFSDGLTDQIITSLSKVPDLFVIARNSVFTYKNKPVKVQQVAEELGVRYVLEGSVRKSGDRVRITAQLVDALRGQHLWAEKYDRDLKDIFAVQDEITKEILTAMELKLTAGEQARQWVKKPKDLEVYLKHMQARHYTLRFNKEDNLLSQQLIEQIIALDPDYAPAYRHLAWTHLFNARWGWTDSPGKSIERAKELLEKALNMDDSLIFAHSALAFAYIMKRDYEKALEEAEQEVALYPNFPDGMVLLGSTLTYVGRADEAVPLVEKAIRLNPRPPSHYLQILGACYQMSGRCEKAVAVLHRLLDKNPKHMPAQLILASCYALLGRDEEAREVAAEITRIQPNFSLASYATRLPHKNQADRELIVNSLRKAGLK